MNQNFWKKNIPIYVFNVIIIVLVIIIGFISAINYYDGDAYWIIAQGREILKHGIVHTNTLSINPNDSIVVQQWLYDVILAIIYDNLGESGLYFWNLLGWFGLLITSYCLFRIKHVNRYISVIVAVFISVSFQYMNVRPECLSVILMLVECCILESVVNKLISNNWLWFLPLIMLLEINLHASMWFFHIILLLPYIVKIPFVNRLNVFENFVIPIKNIRYIILLMFLVIFINPYGLDSIVYVLKSSPIISYVSITELQPVEYFTEYGIMSLISIILFVLILCKQRILSSDFFMILGLTILSLTMVRNCIFVSIALIYASSYFLSKINFEKEIFSKFITNELYGVFICCLFSILLLGFYSLSNMKTLNVIESKSSDGLYDVITYLNDNTDNDVKLFTGFNTGGIFEFYGYKVYMDSRPELHSPIFNEGDNVLRDYFFLVKGVDTESNYLSPEDYDSIIQKNNFDYIVINNNIEKIFNIYLMSHPDKYDLVINTQSYNLYKVN